MTAADGTATIPVLLPGVPGGHSVKVVSGTISSAVKTIQVTPQLPKVTKFTLAVPAGKPGRGVYLTAKITSGNGLKAGAAVSAYVDGKKVATKLTDSSGVAKIAVKLPALAGKHSIKVVSGTKSATKSFTYGKGVTAKLSKLKTVKAKKTQTIKGSFGTKAGKITITVTDPKGKVTTKIVKLSSKGKFSYKYTTGKKGTYTVRYSYRATPKYYGAKSYKLTFNAK